MTSTANCYRNIRDQCRVHYCNLPTGVPRFRISEMTYYASSEGGGCQTLLNPRSVPYTEDLIQKACGLSIAQRHNTVTQRFLLLLYVVYGLSVAHIWLARCFLHARDTDKRKERVRLIDTYPARSYSIFALLYTVSQNKVSRHVFVVSFKKLGCF